MPASNGRTSSSAQAASNGVHSQDNGTPKPPGFTPEQLVQLAGMAERLMTSLKLGSLLEGLGTMPARRQKLATRELTVRWRIQQANFKYIQSNRLYFLGGLSLCLTFLGFVLWLFKDQRETLLPVLTAVIGLVAGAGGGFIFGQRARVDPQAN